MSYHKSYAGDWNFSWRLEKVKVHPVFKSDERNIPWNYKQISILPTISKIIERVTHTQLLEYFEGGNLLTESQSGFRPNHLPLKIDEYSKPLAYQHECW